MDADGSDADVKRLAFGEDVVIHTPRLQCELVGGTLDFIVIGAQRSGTTSLWRYLDSHPAIHTPASKEAPFFSHPTFARGLKWYLAEYFGDAAPESCWGTVSPQYMMGSDEASERELARRIRVTVPATKLIAILRDPIERAQSQHRLHVHRGIEHREFETAVEELLDPEALREARRPGAARRGYQRYLVAGEYGRILATYLDELPREQLYVLLTDELAQAPAECITEIFGYLGVDPAHLPGGLDAHHNRGGRGRRLDAQAEATLKEYLSREVWPETQAPRLHERAFDFWFIEWNIIPDEYCSSVDPALRTRLQEHFAQDARRLEQLLGRPVPWAHAASAGS